VDVLPIAAPASGQTPFPERGRPVTVKPTVLSHYLDPSRNAGYTRAGFAPVAHL